LTLDCEAKPHSKNFYLSQEKEVYIIYKTERKLKKAKKQKEGAKASKVET
jgi:hypothetical protein